MPRWIAVAYDRPSEGVTDAAVIEAADIDEAATRAAQWIQEEWNEKSDPVEVLNVYVAPWDDRVAYQTALVAERAEMQCCGGPNRGMDRLGGHWAGCPEVSDEDEVEDEATREMDAAE